jgi:hypothetical protein
MLWSAHEEELDATSSAVLIYIVVNDSKWELEMFSLRQVRVQFVFKFG